MAVKTAGSRWLQALLAVLLIAATAAQGAAATLEQMAGQMIMIGFAGRSGDDAGTRRIVSDIAGGRIGGVILFERNIADPAQLRALTGELTRAGGDLQPFIAIDEEGGRIQRLPWTRGRASVPSAALMARTRSLEETYGLYYRMALALASYGINLNLAPVVDLDINVDSPVIGRLGRSFGSDGETVFAYAKAFISAHRWAGVLTCLKHWPGHGSAAGDSHKGATRGNAADRAREEEVHAELVAAGLADAVMASHVIVDDGGRQVPASLSRASIRDGLREGAGFAGFVISDDMQMGTITEVFALEEAVVRAVDAGVDVVIFANMLTYDPEAGEKARAAILAAVRSGRIGEERVREAYERIVALKARIGRRR